MAKFIDPSENRKLPVSFIKEFQKCTMGTYRVVGIDPERPLFYFNHVESVLKIVNGKRELFITAFGWHIDFSRIRILPPTYSASAERLCRRNDRASPR